MTMKMKYAITTFAALAFVAAGPLFLAAASADDTMKPETTKPESMKADHMKGDAMKGDAMKGDAMKSGHAGDDAMGGTQK
jgi:pentapeptide MXKDX repeat protein